jgi:hypothetical protein
MIEYSVKVCISLNHHQVKSNDPRWSLLSRTSIADWAEITGAQNAVVALGANVALSLASEVLVIADRTLNWAS